MRRPSTEMLDWYVILPLVTLCSLPSSVACSDDFSTILLLIINHHVVWGFGVLGASAAACGKEENGDGTTPHNDAMAARARAMAAALDDGPIMMAVIGDGRWSRQILLRYNTIITPEFLFVCFFVWVWVNLRGLRVVAGRGEPWSLVPAKSFPTPVLTNLTSLQ